MSNKCRGWYAIKGEGMEPLVSELNKRVQLHEENLLAGGGMVTCAFVDITDMLGSKWAGRTVKGGAHLGPDGNLVWDYAPETVYFTGRGDDWPLIIKEGKAEFWAETRWAPPVDALTILSEIYPVEITLSYSLQCDNWMNGRSLRFSQGNVTQVRYGDFLLAEQGQPIHHWLVTCPGSTVTLIKEAGITLFELFDDDDGNEPALGEDVVVAIRNAAIATVRGMAGVSECLPYTLDEDSYVRSVQTDLEWGVPYPPDGKFIDILERPIDLLPHEVDLLYQKMVDLAREAARHRHTLGFRLTEEVTEIELARYGRYFGQICTPNQVFRPTAREINLLVDAVSAERGKELLEALGKPAWTERWPHRPATCQRNLH